MCLSIVYINSRDPHESGTGWKVFRRRGGRLYPEVIDTGDPYEIREWYEAYDLGKPLGGYLLGFHIFTTEAAAEVWKDSGPETVVRPVCWRHQLATGTQRWHGRNLKIVVAKEIMIPRPRRRSG